MLSRFSGTAVGRGRLWGEGTGHFPLKFSLDSCLHLQTQDKYDAL